mmetsp:Transcript_23824/g.20004  ORF Transcript_23824/g.20004 Transcript_23824/m.20004 type:complete len:95 (+) Transcript_23824:847-1131(+)
MKENTQNIKDFLSCNLVCLKSLISVMQTNGSFDPAIFIKNYTGNLQALESEDLKSEKDVAVEEIAAKEGDALAVFNEMISVDLMSPQLLKSLLE